MLNVLIGFGFPLHLLGSQRLRGHRLALRSLLLNLIHVIQEHRRYGQHVRRTLSDLIGVWHIHYILVGAVSILFHQAPECQRLTGRDPQDDAVIEAHADALVSLFVGADPERNPR